MLAARFTRKEQEDALLRQVGVAHQQGNSRWLLTVAREAEQLQVAEIAPVRGGQRRRRGESSGSSRDVRLLQDPTFPRVVSDAALGRSGTPPVENVLWAAQDPAGTLSCRRSLAPFGRWTRNPE